MESTSTSETGERRPLRSKRGQFILLATAVLWVFAVGGIWIVWGYENAPGTVAAPPTRWPTESRIPRASNGATLIMMAHPKCPCTRATVGELARLMAHTQGRVTAYVLLLKSKGAPDNWEKTDLWYSAASIPGVHVLADEDGIEAERFHATTSGETMLYDKDGHLLFSGGITASRGLSGGSAGRNAIVSLLVQGESEQTQTLVFGCPLFDPSWKCRTDTGGAGDATAGN